MTDGRKMACWGAAGFIGTALLIVGATPAHSQPPVEVIAQKGLTQVVHYSDLSLTTRQGKSALIRRVSYAVGKVCPGYDEVWVLYDVDGCKKVAWKGARPQIRRAFDKAISGAPMAMTITIQAAAK
jgi:UrcA family protein